MFVHGFLVDAHAVVRRTRAAGGAGLPDLRADLAARRAHHGRWSAGADLSPRGVAQIVLSLPADARPQRRDPGRQRHRGRGLPVRPRRGRLADRPRWCSPTATRSTPSRRSRSTCSSGWAGTRRPPGACCSRCGSPRCATAGSGSAGWSRRKLDRRGEPALGDAVPHRCGRTPRRHRASPRGWRAEDLADVATRLRQFDRPVLLCWAPKDPFFKIDLGAPAGRRRSRTPAWSSSPTR